MPTNGSKRKRDVLDYGSTYLKLGRSERKSQLKTLPQPVELPRELLTLYNGSGIHRTADGGFAVLISNVTYLY